MHAATEASRSEPTADAVDIAEAALLLADASEASEHEPAQAEADDRVPAADDDAPRDTDADAIEEAPDFWSADDKALWPSVPTALRPLLRKYEQQRIAFVNEKVREAARARDEAAQAAAAATARSEQTATWWMQNGPALQQAFADKWAAVDWNRLAGENPSEWARLRQQRDDEAARIDEANQRGQADIEIARERALHALQEARIAEHAKLAERLPRYFGPESAAETYQALGRFLLGKGISPDRINAIHEAPIIELALAAMRFEQAQKQASTATGSTATSTARTTPTRIEPGPGARAGSRDADAARQVAERFRQGGGASIADAAELIRLSGL